MSYNADAQVFETQIVVTNTTQPAGVTSGSIINKGSLSTFDTFVTKALPLTPAEGSFLSDNLIYWKNIYGWLPVAGNGKILNLLFLN